MTLEALKNARQQAMVHLLTCRRVRNEIAADIDSANKARELVPTQTLDLHDKLVIAEGRAKAEYTRACAAVDAHLDNLAGITREPRP